MCTRDVFTFYFKKVAPVNYANKLFAFIYTSNADAFYIIGLSRQKNIK